MNKEDLEKVISMLDEWKTPDTHTLFFSREPRQDEKYIMEAFGLKYQVIACGLADQLDGDKDTIYVVPNAEKYIKIVYQKERYI